MMSIDAVYILNLGRLKDSRIWCYNGLIESGCPEDIIETFPAIDNEIYKTARDLVDAAAEEFPIFSSLIGRTADIAHLSQCWSKLRWYRHLIENDQTAMLIQDRRYLTISYQELLESMDLLKQSDPDFLYAVLDYAMDSAITDIRWVPNSLWIHDIDHVGQADWGQVVTPAGAEFIISNFDFSHTIFLEWFRHTHSLGNEHIYILAGNTENGKWTVEVARQKIVAEGYEFFSLRSNSELPSSVYDKTGKIRRKAEKI